MVTGVTIFLPLTSRDSLMGYGKCQNVDPWHDLVAIPELFVVESEQYIPVVSNSVVVK
jgi:hypothetical protein